MSMNDTTNSGKKQKRAFEGQRVTKGPRNKSSYSLVKRLLGTYNKDEKLTKYFSYFGYIGEVWEK